MTTRTFASDIERIYHEWHERNVARDAEGVVDLYALDAVFESPIVASLMNQQSGTIQGREALQRFFRSVTAKFHNPLVHWHRPPEYFTNGRTLIWEYPRQTPTGDQVEIVEVMDLLDGKIQHHRVYWGWFGLQNFLKSGQPAK
jgi:SnoaL-like domain